MKGVPSSSLGILFVFLNYFLPHFHTVYAALAIYVSEHLEAWAAAFI